MTKGVVRMCCIMCVHTHAKHHTHGQYKHMTKGVLRMCCIMCVQHSRKTPHQTCNTGQLSKEEWEEYMHIIQHIRIATHTWAHTAIDYTHTYTPHTCHTQVTHVSHTHTHTHITHMIQLTSTHINMHTTHTQVTHISHTPVLHGVNGCTHVCNTHTSHWWHTHYHIHLSCAVSTAPHTCVIQINHTNDTH